MLSKWEQNCGFMLGFVIPASFFAQMPKGFEDTSKHGKEQDQNETQVERPETPPSHQGTHPGQQPPDVESADPGHDHGGGRDQVWHRI